MTTIQIEMENILKLPQTTKDLILITLLSDKNGETQMITSMQDTAQPEVIHNSDSIKSIGNGKVGNTHKKSFFLKHPEFLASPRGKRYIAAHPEAKKYL